MSFSVARPLAITMWDFSWLERRWPGAGYEDWDRALDELAERGYDAVRIDAFPHLIAQDPYRVWDLPPTWTQHEWGATARQRLSVQPALTTFIGKCAERGIGVGLSTWMRQDVSRAWAQIRKPVDIAEAWRVTLAQIEGAGLLGAILYVDLGNEFPLSMYTPYLYGGEELAARSRTTAEMAAWMNEPIEVLRTAYPGLSFTWSFNNEFDTWRDQDVSAFDLLELHIWMTFPETSDFYERIGYRLGPDRFEGQDYETLARDGEAMYRRDEAYWRSRLTATIDLAAQWSRGRDLPLVTTECWAVINFKDGPHLDWGWVKELCDFGVRQALGTGRWAALATSNFCGPQFPGMWRDVEWHRRLTDAIHAGAAPTSGVD